MLSIGSVAAIALNLIIFNSLPVFDLFTFGFCFSKIWVKITTRHIVDNLGAGRETFLVGLTGTALDDAGEGMEKTRLVANM